jgi:cytohesin
MIRKRPIPQRTLEQDFSNAIQKSNTKNMEALLEKGVNPQAEYDLHPIFFDAPLPHLRVLLKHGLDINVPSSYNGMTMLSYLCYYHNRWNPNSNHTELITFLLEQGADTLVADIFGDTPLHNQDEQYVDPAILRLLLQYGADPNLQNNEGNTPLHKIGENRVSIPGRPNALPYAECIRILVEAGANPLEKNEEGQTPSEYAEAMRAKDEILQALIQAERNAGSEKEMPEEIRLPLNRPNPQNQLNMYGNQQNMFNGGSRASGVQAFNGGSRASGGRRKNRKTRRRRQAHKKRTHRRR